MADNERSSEGARASSSNKPERSVDNSRKCKTCGQCFSREEYISSHRNQCEAKHACSFCGKRFASTRTLGEHQLVHLGMEPYACPVCGRKFATKASLIRHKLIHTDEKPYACEICPSKFSKQIYLDKHKDLHASGVDMFHCLDCNKTFTKAALYHEHVKWHTKEKPYACHLCPARLRTRQLFENHVLRHSGEKPHTCPVCKSEFSWPSVLRTHMRQKHGGVKPTAANADSGDTTSAGIEVEPSSPSPMGLPGVAGVDIKVEPGSPPPTLPSVPDDANNEGPDDAAFGNSSSDPPGDIVDSSIGTLEGAATSSSNEPETSVGSEHERDKCGQSLANKTTLQSDLVVQTSKEQHICNLCHHEFATWLEFVVHKCTRSGEKPYACELCPARFSHRKGMDKHRRLHANGVDLHNCPKCGMAFRHMKMLQRHLIAHEGAKPHVCHLCPASFRTKYNLEDHVLQHAVEKPHTCTMCKKAFRWRWGLQEHIRRTHGGVKAAVSNAECSVDVTTPSSPLPTPPSVPVKSNNEGPADTASGSSVSETSRDIVDSNIGNVGGATGTSPKESERSGISVHERDRHEQRSANNSSLNSHQAVQAGKKPHVCNLCWRRFSTPSRLAVHQRIHTGEKPYACQMCPAKFPRKVALDRHEKQHAGGVELHHCRKCGKTFRQMKTLQQHLSSHEVEKPFTCHVCAARFTDVWNLKQHVLRHMCEKPHTCPVCKRTFAWRTNLLAHIRRVHKGAKATVSNSGVDVTTPGDPLTTAPPALDDTSNEGPAGTAHGINSSESSRDIMDSSIGTPKGATEPSPGKRESSVDSTHKCDKCGQSFSGEEYRRHHMSCTGRYACTICGKTYASSQSLYKHRYDHSVKDRYVCRVCGYKCSRKSSLIRHERKHTGERPYACEMCPSRLATKDSLDRHRKLHASGVKMFHCLDCGIVFKTEAGLQEHLRYHKTVKPYACHLCPDRFTHQNFLERHVLKHTCEKPHVCPTCKREFSSGSSLAEHIHSMHGGAKATVVNTDSGVDTVAPSSPLTTLPPGLWHVTGVAIEDAAWVQRKNVVFTVPDWRQGRLMFKHRGGRAAIVMYGHRPHWERLLSDAALFHGEPGCDPLFGISQQQSTRPSSK
ncbi:hypothetical protein HPB50_023939 [Hyalomma asiaticum]|uniref:Uncharacterized protein n=1 Tax=Hyalomma asiaticum TaxID=266040 RepID=A0ACB7T6P1_HYAAI|nr:hypothetical protein HPB50_023939 [Hyalomma asiaticum]